MKKLLLLITLFSISLFHTSLFAQWVQQTVPVSKPITGIKFIDTNTGWACTSISTLGDTSFILNTTNGGVNWNIQFVAFNIALYAISIIDANTGYCGGSSGPGRLFKTTNGGINWNEIGTPTRVTDMFFVNKDSGWICNETSTADVRTTTDGGTTWQLRNSSLTFNCFRLFFLNYNTGWVASDFDLFKTTNAGVNWIQKGNFLEGIRSIFFFDETTGWLGMTNDKIVFTSNGGNNWIYQTNPGLAGTNRDIIMYRSGLGYIGNRTLRIYKTTDGGILWGYQRDSAASYRISFIDSLKGWSGDFGIAKTTNGGGNITYLGIININNNIPNAYKLYQNYPNPFNSQTNIKFSLTKRSVVAFKIYDILGREKTIWHSDKQLDAGTHELQFNAEDFASGVYFYSIIVSDETGSTRFKETRKMILVK
ncbi:MAG: T9SS type A sorting domain-containing protein [Ignavibacteria bacterium]